MEKEYRKELDRVYLLLTEDQIDEDEYVMQMALRQKLSGILPVSVFAKDGKKRLQADVTACTSISSRFKSVSLTGSDVRKILSALKDTASRMPSLLMSVRDLYLDPDCIFLGPGGDEVLLCYIPHVSDTEPDSVRLLSEFFLKKLDHSDQTAVSLVYPLYDQVSSDSYDLTEILSRLLQSGQRGEDAAAPAKDNPPKAAQETVRSGIPEREEFSDSNVRRLPPPDTRRRRAKSTSGHSRRKAAGQRTAAARKKQRRNLSGALPGPLLPAAVILPAAVVLIVVFQMDLTQMMGMGFLCAALIWIIHSSLEKHASEGRNIWFDEEEASQSDELFYQSLREELYAEDARFGKSAVKDPAAVRSGAYDRPTGSGASAHPIGSGGYDPPIGSGGYDHRVGNGASSVRQEQTRCLRPQVPSLVSLRKDLYPDILLDQDYLILGKKSAQADVVLPDDTVSRKHARIERRIDGYYVTDLFSTNGTFLDGHRLESGRSVLLKDGAQLRFASLSFRAAIPEASREASL